MSHEFMFIFQAAYSVTDLLNELDSGDEQAEEKKQEEVSHTGAEQSTDNTDHVEVTQRNTMDNNTDKSNLTDKDTKTSEADCPSAQTLPESDDIPQMTETKTDHENNEVSDSKDSDVAMIEENDLYESADKVVCQPNEHLFNSEEDESSGTGDNSVWKRKKMVKKRKFRSERKDPGYETIDANKMHENTTGSIKSQSSKKRSGYENVDVAKKRTGYENVHMDSISDNRANSGAYSQVTRQRITSDISGRMVITGGSLYADTDEYSKKVQTLDRSVDTLERSSEATDTEKVSNDVLVLENEKIESASSDGCFEEKEEEEIYEDTLVEPGPYNVPADEQGTICQGIFICWITLHERNFSDR